jgi:hypothetical protein
MAAMAAIALAGIAGGKNYGNSGGGVSSGNGGGGCNFKDVGHYNPKAGVADNNQPTVKRRQ